MPLPTLDQFIADHAQKLRGFPRSSYVRERGIQQLYVRLGPRYIKGEKRPVVLDIANVIVAERYRGKGRFTALLARLRRDYFDIPIYLESVLNPRLVQHLRRIGCEELPGTEPPCFVLITQRALDLLAVAR
jgi:GNAT superfamily N-acetyltransferase